MEYFKFIKTRVDKLEYFQNLPLISEADLVSSNFIIFL